MPADATVRFIEAHTSGQRWPERASWLRTLNDIRSLNEKKVAHG